MSDSVKLRFEHGILHLVFSYLALIAVIVFGFLSVIVNDFFAVLALCALILFTLFVINAFTNFKDAVDYLKKECTNDHIKKVLNKTLD